MFSECSAGCGEQGVQQRTRECNNPEPAHGGEGCEGALSETVQCAGQPCRGKLILRRNKGEYLNKGLKCGEIKAFFIYC